MKNNSQSNKINRPGSIKSIQSASNPIIKSIRGLISQRKHRRESGLFVAEGLKLVIDAQNANWEIDTLIICNEVKNHESVSKIATNVHAKGGSLIEVTSALLKTITRKDNPQMVLGVFKQKTIPIEKIQFEDDALWIGLEQIRDPGNLGTILRTADAVGASGILLIGDSTDPFSVEAVRASMGSIFHVPISISKNAQITNLIKNWPVKVTGTHLKGTIDFRDADYGKKRLLLMGNEQKGLSDDLTKICDNIVRIPQSGKADSLNIAVATGIALYEICKRELVV